MSSRTTTPRPATSPPSRHVRRRGQDPGRRELPRRSTSTCTCTARRRREAGRGSVPTRAARTAMRTSPHGRRDRRPVRGHQHGQAHRGRHRQAGRHAARRRTHVVVDVDRGRCRCRRASPSRSRATATDTASAWASTAPRARRGTARSTRDPRPLLPGHRPRLEERHHPRADHRRHHQLGHGRGPQRSHAALPVLGQDARAARPIGGKRSSAGASTRCRATRRSRRCATGRRAPGRPTRTRRGPARPSSRLDPGARHAGRADRTYRTALRSAQPTPDRRAATRSTCCRSRTTRGVSWRGRCRPRGTRRRSRRSQSRPAPTGCGRSRPTRHYDICDTTSCQVYGGVDAETAATDSAIAATAGKILTYDGKPAFTQFSSSSGGYTRRAASLSQGGQGPVGRLVGQRQPLVDQVGQGLHDPGEVPQDRHAEIAQVTKRNGHGDWGGRVTSLKIVGTKGTTTISGDDARWAFGLRSNWFTF